MVFHSSAWQIYSVFWSDILIIINTISVMLWGGCTVYSKWLYDIRTTDDGVTTVLRVSGGIVCHIFWILFLSHQIDSAR